MKTFGETNNSMGGQTGMYKHFTTSINVKGQTIEKLKKQKGVRVMKIGPDMLTPRKGQERKRIDGNTLLTLLAMRRDKLGDGLHHNM